MPRNPLSEARKERIVALLEDRFGPLDRNHPYRSDWYSTGNGKMEVFITDSKAHFSQRPWFGMKNDDIEELVEHPAAFVIFILGEDDNYLVIPAKHLADELPNHNEGITEDGFYHFNILLGANTFKQLPHWKLNQYRDKTDSIGP